MKKIEFIKLIVLLSVALCFSACGKTQATVSSAPDVAPPTKNIAAKDTIGFLEDRIKRDPEDFIAHNKLASEYLQKVRETGDVTYLNLALRAARVSLSILPAEQNKGGLTVLAQAEFSSHDFAAARDHALQLTRLEPNKSYAYQILGDALLELGNYEEAENAFRQMEKLGSLQGLTQTATEQRLARRAFLRGDKRGAAKHFEAALKLAQNLPVPSPETVAWCEWQLGETAFSVGDYNRAEKYYRAALETFPGYFRAVASLGKTRAALGDLAGAIEQYETVVRILPDPNFVAALGDLYKLAGRADDAQKQYELVEQIGHLSELNGTIYNRQLALFYADHDLKAEEACKLAAKEYEVRRDIYGADALAWTLYKKGLLTDAKTAITAALNLKTNDARILYHAGMIEKDLGNRAEAKKRLEAALKINPMFDLLQAETARKALSELK
jgi:tetratricopeptide (TPR) repeat protein